MAKVEITYNPYLLNTDITFNGHKPHINSLVEKFHHKPMQDWVKKIPKIFYDEMNGYDFSLEFSGTKLDYEEVRQAFAEAKVSEEDVTFVYKNELDNRVMKLQAISHLAEWLENHANRNFDLTQFKEENEDLYDQSVPFIIYQGSQITAPSFEGIDVEVEHIDNISEIAHTNMRNVPVLVYISENNIDGLQKLFSAMADREQKDIKDRQVFFIIAEDLDEESTIRIIEDLGVTNPQIVSSIDDYEIEKYVLLYPITEYIYQSIQAFERSRQDISQIVDEQTRQNAEENAEIYDNIDKLNRKLDALKRALDMFINRDNLILPKEWNEVKVQLSDRIDAWQSRKTKITSDDEAGRMAIEFQENLDWLFKDFLEKVDEAVAKSKADLDAEHLNRYQSAGVDVGHKFDIEPFNRVKKPILPDIRQKVMSLKEEKFVEEKEDIFGKFFGKSTSSEEKKMVLQITYYYADWRKCASNDILPLAVSYLNDLFEQMKHYEEQSAVSYENYLKVLIQQMEEMKVDYNAMLSDEGQKLQNDKNWLTAVEDQLNVIEGR